MAHKLEDIEQIIKSAKFKSFCHEYDFVKKDIVSSDILPSVMGERHIVHRRRVGIVIAAVSAIAASIALFLIYNNYFHTHITTPQRAEVVQSAIDTTRPFILLSSGESVALESNQAVADIIKQSAKDTLEADAPARKVENSVVYIPKGTDYLMTLPDSSKVWLLADSRLTFVSNFADGKREVKLEGEAYFDIVHDEAHPFIVHTNILDIIVLGTEFNVQAYPQEEKIVSTLMRGSVKVSGNGSGAGAERVLKVGEQATMKLGSNKICVKKVDLSQFYSRRSGRLAFRSATLEEVLNYMERWYNMKVIYEDESVKNIILSCDLVRDMDLGVILAYMEKIGVAKFELHNNTLTVKVK